jgi:hypothetical protein
MMLLGLTCVKGELRGVIAPTIGTGGEAKVGERMEKTLFFRLSGLDCGKACLFREISCHVFARGATS